MHSNKEALTQAKNVYRQGKLDLSAQTFDRLTLDKETRAEALYCLGLINLAKGRYVAATKDLAQAIKEFPNSANAHYYLGAVLERRGHQTHAEKYYRHAIELNPRHHAALEKLASHVSTVNVSTEARPGAAGHKSHTSRAPAVFAVPAKFRDDRQAMAYAKWAYQQGKVDLSAQIFDRLTRDKTTRPEALYCLGLANFAQKRLVSAVRFLAAAAKANPKNPNAQLYLALIMKKLGARENFRSSRK
jgi:Flp pilus assembly protein TadD